MRAFLASILLFFYTLTCIGTTVNMHQCHGGTIFILQENVENHHENCPLCHDHEKESASSHICDNTSEKCCKDIQIDLKKSQEEVENVQTLLSFPTISPAILTLVWISAFHSDVETTTSSTPPDRLSAILPSNPTYLIHCNFRI